MGRVLIELPENVDIRISAENITEALKTLKNMLTSGQGKRKLAGIRKFRGIVSSTSTTNEEEWYRQ
jgi:hypothetical protein